MMVQSKRPAFDKILSICADQRRSEDNVRPRCLCSLTVERALPFQVYGNFTREVEEAPCKSHCYRFFFQIKQ